MSVSVIVADELPLVSEGLAALCDGFAGCRVLGHASQGEQAWMMIERLEPDIAVLALNLSAPSTVEILRRVREGRLATKVVVVSARVDRRTMIDILRAGAKGFVVKACAGRHLEEAIAQITQGGVYVCPQIELDQAMPATRDGSLPLKSLSTREHQVFILLVEGVRAKDIAARLALSPKTVDTYRASLMRKLDIHDVPGLVKFAIQHKVTQLD
ncbi:MAG: response regulator transcription factor [Acidobacteria bacterium]|nr:response regulator transcription factor [Acidobacteriota bacterium]